ncbi:MAG TPA: MFS transporter [Gammaproteobacteria bacterium]|jgi:MHS family proline/betaine transporter-like MFS transporter|nr:MFS transporter [Gammaproteobacteria bacterium]
MSIPAKKSALSSITSSSLGNILEWYDFGLFAIFSALFGRLFFPTTDPNTALIATFSIFAVGFLCRPIGALIFGYLGDKYGRAKTLRLSILMITLPTLLIGLLPSYQQIGIFAPILLTLTRVWQGISIGGEYSGTLIYLAETAPAAHRALFTSFASTGANIGVLLAALVGVICSSLFSEAALHDWGWRVPYLISGLFCLFMYQYRLRLQETAVFDYLKNKKLLVANPIKTMLQHNIPQLLRTLGLVCVGSTFYYFCFVYLPIYLTSTLQISTYATSLLMMLLISLMIVLVPITGYLCDRWGRRPLLLFNAFFIAGIVIPGFYFLQIGSLLLISTVLVIFVIASSLEQGTTSVAVVENFPLPARYTGLSFSYNIGNGLLGGTVPMVCAWLMTLLQNPLAPAMYIALCAVITGVVVFCWVPETRGRALV